MQISNSLLYEPLDEEETLHVIEHDEYPYSRVLQSQFLPGDYYRVINAYQDSLDYPYDQWCKYVIVFIRLSYVYYPTFNGSKEIQTPKSPANEESID